MIFWDSSALVRLLVTEPGSAECGRLLREDPVVVVWWGTPVECESALQRRLREGSLTASGVSQARRALDQLATAWLEVPPGEELRRLARRLLRTHPLRAADALQLAAALSLAGRGIEKLRFASADQRLAQAAEIEGLEVV